MVVSCIFVGFTSIFTVAEWYCPNLHITIIIPHQYLLIKTGRWHPRFSYNTSPQTKYCQYLRHFQFRNTGHSCYLVNPSPVHFTSREIFRYIGIMDFLSSLTNFVCKCHVGENLHGIYWHSWPMFPLCVLCVSFYNSFLVFLPDKTNSANIKNPSMMPKGLESQCLMAVFPKTNKFQFGLIMLIKFSKK